MSKHKVLVVDSYSTQFFEELAKYSDYVKVSKIDDSIPLDDITILVIRSKTKVTQDLVNGMSSLQVVISSTHGCDHVCVDYLTQKGIRFYNVPVQSYDVAQGVIAYILINKKPVDWKLAPFIVVGAVLSVPLSAKSVKLISEKKLKLAIAFLTIVLGILTIIKTVKSV